MDYNPGSVPITHFEAHQLPELVRQYEKDLLFARLSLSRLKLTSVPWTVAADAMSTFEAVLTQNAEHAASIHTWLQLDLVKSRHKAEAHRALGRRNG